MPTENERPKTEEDLFAETVEAARAAKEAPVEAKPAPAAEAPAPQPQARASEPVRDPNTGQFRRDDGGKAPPAPPPFEGFDKLDPAAKQWIERTLGEHDGLQRKYVRSQNQLRQREQALREALGTGKPRPTQPITQRQPDAPAPGSPAPTAEAAKAWDAYKAQFPDDAKALEERIAATEGKLGRKLTEIEQRLARLDEMEQALKPVRETAARFEAREQEEVKAQGRGYFDEAAPNWEYLAGWKDEQGNRVPPEEQAFAPDFQAWLDAIRDHSPSVADMYEAQLAHHDPVIVAKVWQDFNRDYAEATGAPHPMLRRTTDDNRPRAPVNPTQQRREAARSDVQPRPAGSPGGTRPAPAPQGFSPRSAEEEAFAAAVTADNLRHWRGLR